MSWCLNSTTPSERLFSRDGTAIAAMQSAIARHDLKRADPEALRDEGRREAEAMRDMSGPGFWPMSMRIIRHSLINSNSFPGWRQRRTRPMRNCCPITR